ncbi:uncharacterized protein LOC128558867 [Mercenaria mercenaria]|uniref:uncharacterized protein LOC128558867 n=1 Tax=Mercenaria mercenaria TaxID=6596 RepID=UPI00234E643C|nr:uncharacterized protein LOC128558867 [Mercenaria mercenaria]
MDSIETRFCTQCLDDIERLSKATAFCKQCNEYICSDLCLRQHAKNRLSKNHCFLLDDELKDYLEKKGIVIDTGNAEERDCAPAAKHKQAVLRTEFNIRAASDKEICSIHASAVLGNGFIVLADLKNSNLKLFDPDKRTCTAVLKLEKGPRDICASNVNDTDLYVNEAGVKGIHLINTIDFSISKTLPTEGECYGVACWKRGIAVTSTSYKTYYGQYELQLLDYHGRVNRKFIVGKVKNLEFNLPWYLSSNVDGQQILISDFGNHRVTCIDVDGSVIFVYKDSDLIRPVSLSTDNENDIFVVSQRSHCIHHLSCKGEKRGVVYAENSMEYPGGISFDLQNDRFCVQCIGWSDIIQLFDISSEPAWK